MFETWSPKFNRTLQGATDLAPHNGFGGSTDAVRNYAERNVREESFTLKLKSGYRLGGDTSITITHDVDFLLDPMSVFEEYNPDFISKSDTFVLPVKRGADTRLFGLRFSKANKYTNDYTEPLKLDILEEDSKGFRTKSSTPARFYKREGLENFMEMAVQAVLSSPEKDKGFSAPNLDPSKIGMEEFPEGVTMTREKFLILQAFQNVVLGQETRNFIM